MYSVKKRCSFSIYKMKLIFFEMQNMHVLLLLIYIQNWLSVQSWPPLPLEPASPPGRPYRNSPSDSWSSPPPYSFLAGTWQKTLSLAAYLVTSLCQHCHYTKRKYHLLYLFHKLEVLSAITSYIEGGVPSWAWSWFLWGYSIREIGSNF